jgi:hypothetical protein
MTLTTLVDYARAAIPEAIASTSGPTSTLNDYRAFRLLKVKIAALQRYDCVRGPKGVGSQVGSAGMVCCPGGTSVGTRLRGGARQLWGIVSELDL